VPAAKIVAAIENYVPSNNRSQLKAIDTNTFILDAYNANPTSMKVAIGSFSSLSASNKVAVLGAMKELGEYSEEEHEAVARMASDGGFDKLVLVGEEFRQAAGHVGAIFFEDTTALKAWFKAENFIETHFLVKGSRSIGLERMLED
jgi:UDP-N-acetylmuramoyl-tripeptide--D-alanyl-D-alanine ligase